ncbi:MAG: hypothetical protein P9L96_03240 [Candidatus Gygaella obscura]|nr:hypothetical protein [Candidatus Gygaella obscura]
MMTKYLFKKLFLMFILLLPLKLRLLYSIWITKIYYKKLFGQDIIFNRVHFNSFCEFELHFLKGIEFLKNNNFDSAIACFNKCLTLDIDYKKKSNLYFYLSQCYNKLGNHELYADCLIKCLEAKNYKERKKYSFVRREDK